MVRIMQICAIDTTMAVLLGELNRGTTNKGYETIGICSKGSNREQIENDGVILIDIHIDRKISLSNIKSVFEIYKAIKKYKPDIVHVHTPIAAVLGRIAAKIAGISNIIYTAHGFYFHEHMKPLVYKVTYFIEKFMARFFTDYIFTQSEEDAQLAIQGRFLPEDRIICISNGVDVNGKFNPKNINQEEIEELYSEFNLTKEDIIVSFIGRMVAEKGIFDLLEAFKYVKRKNVKLLVIGGSAQGERDLETINKIKIYESEPNIIFTGSRSDINNLLYISDIFCLPSYREGMPRSIIEAMSMENAVIATNIRGSREEVIDGETGYLVPLNDSHNIKEKIEELIDHEFLLNIMKKQGRKRAVEHYNESEIVAKQIEIFNKIITENVEGGIKMGLYESIKNRTEKISVIGLGYVGLPLAISFAKKADVIGFDISKEKVEQYLNCVDVTKEVGNDALKETSALITADEKHLRNAKFHIVAVPTPINIDKTPDLKPIIGASQIVGRNMIKGSIVVFESTVYPGVTEDICVPILEQESGLKCGTDFKVGYSPERINPGDQLHRLENIVKVVSGMDEESLDNISKVYEMIIEAGVHRADSIKVAEAAKVIENSQRDINIAFMNELSIIFNKLHIDTKAVLEAAGTKWNFLSFNPGLVGGHCIGVDPYYLTYKAEELGYHSQIIGSGRRINDEMGKYVAENTVKKMIQANKQIRGAKVAILGITFKENCSDSRNTKVIDIIKEFMEYGIEVQVVDPVADKEEVRREYGIDLYSIDEIQNVDAVVVAVSHNEFMSMGLKDLNRLYKTCDAYGMNSQEEVAAAADEINENIKQVLIDVKGVFDKKDAEDMNYLYWRL